MQETREKISIREIELIALGHVAFQLFWAGIELGLYELLSHNPGLTEAEIQERLGLQERPTRILVVGLLSLGIVEREGEAFRNSPIVEEYLVEGKPGYIAPVFGWQAHIVYPALVDFVAALRENRHVGLRHFPGSGDTLYERLASDPAMEKVFQDSMSALTRHTNPGMLNAYDFGQCKHVLDVGGGDGTNAISLAKTFPPLRVTLFDMPSVGEIARKNIHEEGLDDRIDVHVGNFLTDPFPEHVDAVIFNHILVIWSEQRNRELLRKSYEALPPGGTVFIYSMICQDDDMGPLSAAFGSTYFLTMASGEGMLYRWKDYEAWLKDAGFSRVERIEGLPLHHGLVIGIKDG